MALRRLGGIGFWAFGIGAVLFLYIPLILLVLFSFNDSVLPGLPFRGLTLRWYRELSVDPQAWDAARSSVLLAALSAIASTTIGGLAAWALSRRAIRLKQSISALLILPVLIPEFLIGVALLIFFYSVAVPLSLGTAAVGHILLSVPFTTLVILARFKALDRTLEAAAADLGATPWGVFRHVTLPALAPGLLASALLSFTLSMDQFLITLFTIGPDTTLPIYIWSALKFELTPKVNALGSIIFFVSFCLVLLVYRLGGLRGTERSRA